MRAVIQRVLNASVYIEGQVVSQIDQGLLILIGIEDADGQEDLDWLANKIVNMRIFADENGLMNLSVKEINGQILLVSQFTLFAQTKKGNRPGFTRAAKPEKAIPLYEQLIEELTKQAGKRPQTGRFGANMTVTLINDGPVTICMDTKNKE